MLSFHTKDTCSLCKNKAKEVSPVTIRSLVKKEYQKELSSIEEFYYCKTPDCEVVYFKANEIIRQNKLIKKIGLKDWANPSTICYCFDWTKERINKEILDSGRTNVIEDISSKMNTIKCNCEVNNPSGKCCLKDVKQVLKALKNDTGK